ncbi:MAG: DNA internalization-related competence protein ComEC/Rec2 [Dehalococcoidia bacterium]|nr:DNA internalization-related competence protein ComEC/Rec2 [Dehalococcoidia bacterium]
MSIAWVVGVFLGSMVALPPLVVVPLSAVVLAAAILWRRKVALLWGGLCLVTLLGGLAWYHFAVNEPSLGDSGGRIVVLEGEVVQDPRYGDGGSWFSFSAERLCTGDSREKVSGKVLVYTDVLSSYSQGDVLRVMGRVEPLSEVGNLDYRTFLQRQGFVGTINDPDIEMVRRSWLFSLRERLSRSISSALPEPQASLAQGLLLGMRSHMPDEVKSAFTTTGTSHILAVSGFHLAIVGGTILGFSAWLFGRQRPAYLVVTLVMVWLYAALTGMQPPIMRAAIMFSLHLVALWLGRPGSALTAVALAGAFMVGLNPKVMWAVSFQLSFMAVLGLILIQPRFQEMGERVIPEGSWVSSALKPIFVALTVGLAAIVATLPLMVYYFQSLSLVGLPATVVASAFVPGATVLSGITAFIGLLVPKAAWVVGWGAWFFLMGLITTVEWFARLPFALVEVGPVNAAFVWGYYLVLLSAIAGRRLVLRVARLIGLVERVFDRLGQVAYRLPKKRTAGALVVCASMVWVAVSVLPDTKLTVSVLDVGQGDSILIKTPAGQQILIDGGPSPDTVCQQLGKRMPFWDKSLDMLVLTHSDDDHLVGLMGVLRRYKVSHVLESGYGEGPIYREWLTGVEEKEISWSIARAGQEIDLGEGIVLQVIYPHEDLLEGTDSKPNSNSVVLRLVWNEISFLLTGDADDAAEQEMLYGGVLRGLDCTVLKVGHHGSKYSTTPEFLDAVDPQVAVISVGEGNTFGHPSDELLARLNGVEVYRTDECGTITFSTDGKRLWVKTVK